MVTQLTNTLDYDILPNTYQLTVLASDSGGRRASVPLTVTLTDLNDNPPVFDRPVFEAKLKEGESHFDGPVAVHVRIVYGIILFLILTTRYQLALLF